MLIIHHSGKKKTFQGSFFLFDKTVYVCGSYFVGSLLMCDLDPNLYCQRNHLSQCQDPRGAPQSGFDHSLSYQAVAVGKGHSGRALTPESKALHLTRCATNGSHGPSIGQHS